MSYSTVFHQGDAIEQMKLLPDKSVDLIYSNPPFGSTKQKWDSKINWSAFFTEAFRVLKETGNIVLHCSVPFNYELIRTSPKAPSYSWYWKKDNVTCPLIAKQQPMRNTEEILVWKQGNKYYPQRTGSNTRTFKSSAKSNYYGTISNQPMQTVIGKYQTHHIDLPRYIDGYSTRPDKLIQLIINSYTVAGDTILDPFCNDGRTSQHCPERDWIGIDLFHNPKYLRDVI